MRDRKEFNTRCEHIGEVAEVHQPGFLVQPNRGESPPEPGWLPQDQVAERDSLASQLNRLGPRQRAVLVLRFYLDCSVEETARILGISEGTVKSQAARALEAIRRAYAGQLSTKERTRP